MASKIATVDLDETICDTAHRSHLLDMKPKRWDDYHLACSSDTQHEAMVSAVHELSKRGYLIVYVTGRSEIARSETIKWLQENGLPNPSNLRMRREKDFRKAAEYKLDTIRSVERTYGGRVVLHLDDDETVRSLLTENGVKCPWP